MTPIAGCVMMVVMCCVVTAAPESSMSSVQVLLLYSVCFCACDCNACCYSGLPKEPEGEEEWFCPVCKVCACAELLSAHMLHGLCAFPQNIDRRTKRSRPPNLKELLLLAVRRMMFPGVRLTFT